MNKQHPSPGSRYIVKERLGQGRWKEVYRAVVRGEWHDRALARFIKEPQANELFDEIKLLLPSEARGRLENVAELYRAFKGDDGDIYIEEELLYRPLESLAPLKVVDQFFRIARDLCNGLASLHRFDRVHRDLKLDNCGVDHFGTAKIFDLGSVTSEGGKVRGTNLSRAPELFSENATCTKASDVWAMGAVLFALRTGGNYPFVSKEEARSRPADGEKRRHFDEMVYDRATAQNAETSLHNRIKEDFPNGSGVLIGDMLNFTPTGRPTAAEATERWRMLLLPWAPATTGDSVNKNDSEFEDVLAYLTAVLRGTTDMSSLQWERVSRAIEELESKLDEDRKSKLHAAGMQIKSMRESVAV
jgi:serine/threonine protein kinase